MGGFCQRHSRHPMRYHCIVLVVSYTEAGRSTRINKKLIALVRIVEDLTTTPSTSSSAQKETSVLSASTLPRFTSHSV